MADIYLNRGNPKFNKKLWKLAAAMKTSSKKPLSKPAVKEVKQIVKKLAPKQVMHNGPLAVNQATGYLLSPVANFWQNIQSLTNINTAPAGVPNHEYNRQSDQIYITRIRVRAYIDTVAPTDALRVAILRQKSTGVTPTNINPNLVYQVVSPGAPGLISEIQDDTNISTLFDRVYFIGDAAGMQNARLINIDLKFKNGLPVVYYDGTLAGTPATTVIGDIALCVTSVNGTVNMSYQYDVEFRDK